MPSDKSNPPSLMEFQNAFQQELALLGYTPKTWKNDLVECVNSEGETRTIGVTNLIRRCNTTNPDEWPHLIKDFLSVIILSQEEAASLSENLADATERLLIRVGPPFSDDATAPWSQPIPGTELVISLVIDSEQYMTYVTSNLISESELQPEEWLRKARQNLLAITPANWLAVIHEKTGLRCGHCNDSYDAARSLILSERENPGPNGWLVCVPARDWLFCLPATAALVQHFPVLKLLAEKNFKREPYPISDRVYWVRGQHWEEIRIDLCEDGAKIYPTEEFGRMLAELRQETEAN